MDDTFSLLTMCMLVWKVTLKGYSEVNALHLNIGPHKLLPGEVKYICLLSKNRVAFLITGFLNERGKQYANLYTVTKYHPMKNR